MRLSFLARPLPLALFSALLTTLELLERCSDGSLDEDEDDETLGACSTLNSEPRVQYSLTMQKYSPCRHAPMKSTVLGWRRLPMRVASTCSSISMVSRAAGLTSIFIFLTATTLPRYEPL